MFFGFMKPYLVVAELDAEIVRVGTDGFRFLDRLFRLTEPLQ